ncbi:hypothetical protein HDU79_004575 [Rhizoclosmatium sp. JEL0117]|nr:hypothetical protein HDU79_004575 [Rhizoclosmatium sp. JEL0117]
MGDTSAAKLLLGIAGGDTLHSAIQSLRKERDTNNAALLLGPPAIQPVLSVPAIITSPTVPSVALSVSAAPADVVVSSNRADSVSGNKFGIVAAEDSLRAPKNPKKVACDFCAKQKVPAFLHKVIADRNKGEQRACNECYATIQQYSAARQSSKASQLQACDNCDATDSKMQMYDDCFLCCECMVKAELEKNKPILHAYTTAGPSVGRSMKPLDRVSALAFQSDNGFMPPKQNKSPVPVINLVDPEPVQPKKQKLGEGCGIVPAPLKTKGTTHELRMKVLVNITLWKSTMKSQKFDYSLLKVRPFGETLDLVSSATFKDMQTLIGKIEEVQTSARELIEEGWTVKANNLHFLVKKKPGNQVRDYNQQVLELFDEIGAEEAFPIGRIGKQAKRKGPSRKGNLREIDIAVVHYIEDFEDKQEGRSGSISANHYPNTSIAPPKGVAALNLMGQVKPVKEVWSVFRARANESGDGDTKYEYQCVGETVSITFEDNQSAAGTFKECRNVEVTGLDGMKRGTKWVLKQFKEENDLEGNCKAAIQQQQYFKSYVNELVSMENVKREYGDGKFLLTDLQGVLSTQFGIKVITLTDVQVVTSYETMEEVKKSDL